MTKKTTLLGLFLISFYGCQGQSTSSAKSLLSGVSIDYYSNDSQNELMNSEFNSLSNLVELGAENFYQNNTNIDDKLRTRKYYNQGNISLKRNISVYKIN
tara:strand:+ start:96 stop:395 length:300 start_codon:yes stop_codon:yes gene_type:complete